MVMVMYFTANWAKWKKQKHVLKLQITLTLKFGATIIKFADATITFAHPPQSAVILNLNAINTSALHVKYSRILTIGRICGKMLDDFFFTFIICYSYIDLRFVCNQMKTVSAPKMSYSISGLRVNWLYIMCMYDWLSKPRRWIKFYNLVTFNTLLHPIHVLCGF